MFKMHEAIYDGAAYTNLDDHIEGLILNSPLEEMIPVRQSSTFTGY